MIWYGITLFIGLFESSFSKIKFGVGYGAPRARVFGELRCTLTLAWVLAAFFFVSLCFLHAKEVSPQWRLHRTPFFFLADTVFRRFLSLTIHNRRSTEVPTCSGLHSSTLLFFCFGVFSPTRSSNVAPTYSGKETTPIKSHIHRMPFCFMLCTVYGFVFGIIQRPPAVTEHPPPAPAHICALLSFFFATFLECFFPYHQ